MNNLSSDEEAPAVQREPGVQVNPTQTFVDIMASHVWTCAKASLWFLMYLRLAVLPVVCPHQHRIYAQVRKKDKFPTHLISVGCKHFATLELQPHQHWVNKKGQLRKTKKVRCEPGAHRSWRSFPGVCGFFSEHRAGPGTDPAPVLVQPTEHPRANGT